MSALAEATPGERGHEQERSAPTLFDRLGGEPTLDEVLAGVWEGLAAHRAAACPVCGEEMGPQYGAQALPIGGRCRGCQTALS